jgi:hypothetical protein
MAGRARQTNNSTTLISLDYLLKSSEDQYHNSLQELSDSVPTLLVFLRSFGCCFCREALSDIHFGLHAIEAAGARTVLVHMSSEEEASQILASYGLADVSRISNPDQSLYKSFGVGRGSFDQFFAPRVLGRALEALVNGNPIGKAAGDGLQLPGVFLIHRSRVLKAFLPQTLDSRPDYVKIASTNALAVK